MITLIAIMREALPRVGADAVAVIERELPALVRPHDPRYAEMLGVAVPWVIGRFIDLLEDDEAPLDDVLAFFRRLGANTTSEGIGSEVWRAALQIGAGVAIDELTEAVKDHPGLTATIIGQVARQVFGYVDRIAAAMREGHQYASLRGQTHHQETRRELFDLLIGDEPQPARIQNLAVEARWPLPTSVAAVALHLPEAGAGQGRVPSVPLIALSGLHLSEPALLLPDPDRPRWRESLARDLTDWIAAVGPTVPLHEASLSLEWARRALPLAVDGLAAVDGPLHAEDHLPLLVAVGDREMSDRLVGRALGPLMTIRASQRDRLAETLLLMIECDFNATEVARRLHLHAQTVRYRLRQLEDVFGATLQDPQRRLELHLALYYYRVRVSTT